MLESRLAIRLATSRLTTFAFLLSLLTALIFHYYPLTSFAPRCSSLSSPYFIMYTSYIPFLLLPLLALHAVATPVAQVQQVGPSFDTPSPAQTQQEVGIGDGTTPAGTPDLCGPLNALLPRDPPDSCTTSPHIVTTTTASFTVVGELSNGNVSDYNWNSSCAPLVEEICTQMFAASFTANKVC